MRVCAHMIPTVSLGVCVKTLESCGFRRGGLQPGIAASTTYARLKAASTSAGRVFTQTPLG
jgi:hypothetical protein